MKKPTEVGTNGVPFGIGYKGKAMCENCAYQEKKVPNQNKYLCGYYGGTCQSVSRNCKGIKALK